MGEVPPSRQPARALNVPSVEKVGGSLRSSSKKEPHKVFSYRVGQGLVTADLTAKVTQFYWQLAHVSREMPHMEQFSFSLLGIPSIVMSPMTVGIMVSSALKAISAQTMSDRVAHTAVAVESFASLGGAASGLSSLLYCAGAVSSKAVSWLPIFAPINATMHAVTLAFDVYSAVKTGQLYRDLQNLVTQDSQKALHEKGEALVRIFQTIEKQNLALLKQKFMLSKSAKIQEAMDKAWEVINPSQAFHVQLDRIQRAQETFEKQVNELRGKLEKERTSKKARAFTEEAVEYRPKEELFLVNYFFQKYCEYLQKKVEPNAEEPIVQSSQSSEEFAALFRSFPTGAKAQVTKVFSLMREFLEVHMVQQEESISPEKKETEGEKLSESTDQQATETFPSQLLSEEQVLSIIQSLSDPEMIKQVMQLCHLFIGVMGEESKDLGDKRSLPESPFFQGKEDVMQGCAVRWLSIYMKQILLDRQLEQLVELAGKTKDRSLKRKVGELHGSRKGLRDAVGVVGNRIVARGKKPQEVSDEEKETVASFYSKLKTRVKLTFGLELTSIILKLVIIVGFVLLLAPPLVPVGIAVLASTVTCVVLLFGARCLFVNKDPFDPDSRSLAVRFIDSVSKKWYEFRTKLRTDKVRDRVLVATAAG